MSKTNRTLVIVESPTKAKTISKFLGDEYVVTSSFGHIRDLPESKIGVDVEHDFAPTYVIPDKAKKHVDELLKLSRGTADVMLATDEDREGEAIAWHICSVLGKDPASTKRITFHEITKEAINHAVETPRHIDAHMVDAQQARRVLDRLVGYELSPFLWQKVYRGLSAGRVQSVAVRLIVEREREVRSFKPEEYWTVHGTFGIEGHDVEAELNKLDGKALDKFAIADAASADKLLADLRAKKYSVESVDSKETSRNPYAPFTTSALQQAASSRLGMSPKQTMTIAQKLYEGINVGAEGSVGLITYMRTDSVNLSDKFIADAQEFIGAQYGKDYLTGGKKYAGKSKNAQEAHEAIRPSSVFRTPDSVKQYLDPGQAKLYELIWSRAVASQMPAARLEQTGINITSEDAKATFRATGSVVVFPGWMEAYADTREDRLLPRVKEGSAADAKAIDGKQHFTEPPARYTEAALVKAMEELGIGRPSTYAPTIATIVDRGYVEKREDKKLHPLAVAETVTDLLVEHFPHIADYQFTAGMEEQLDEISRGEKEWVPVLREFYVPFKKNLLEKYETVDKKGLTEEKSDEKCPKCGNAMVIKLGRFGKFLACTNYPECKTTKPLGEDGKPASNEAPEGTAPCENCGKPMVIKRGRFGPFLSCSGYPDCKTIRKIETKLGIKCPLCNEGDLVARKGGKFKRVFYGCNRYPACTFLTNVKPTEENIQEALEAYKTKAEAKKETNNGELKTDDEGAAEIKPKKKSPAKKKAAPKKKTA